MKRPHASAGCFFLAAIPCPRYKRNTVEARAGTMILSTRRASLGALRRAVAGVCLALLVLQPAWTIGMGRSGRAGDCRGDAARPGCCCEAASDLIAAPSASGCCAAEAQQGGDATRLRPAADCSCRSTPSAPGRHQVALTGVEGSVPSDGFAGWLERGAHTSARTPKWSCGRLPEPPRGPWSSSGQRLPAALLSPAAMTVKRGAVPDHMVERSVAEDAAFCERLEGHRKAFG